MSCLAVRDLLPELAVGVLPPRDRVEVERHLEWCAGCRKEASDLGQAAATFGFALAPAPVPQGLADRTVERIERAAGAPGSPRRVRTVAASIVAAMVAIASLGWGAVMAGRADRFAERAARAERDRAAALQQFEQVILRVIPDVPLPEDQTHLGRLLPTAEGQGGGLLLQLTSPDILDFTMVIVNGLDPGATQRLPYRVQVVNATGEFLRVGRIDELDADGSAEVFHEFDVDLSEYATVRVVDASGQVVLVGEVDRL